MIWGYREINDLVAQHSNVMNGLQPMNLMNSMSLRWILSIHV